MKEFKFVRRAIASAIALTCAQSTYAADFEFGDGWEGKWTSSLSLGSSWRAGNPDNRLYGQANGALLGLSDGTGANTVDAGTLNYAKGDRYTTQLKLITEVSAKKGDLGFVVRGKAWYDQALMDENVRLGNQGNGDNNFNVATNSLGAPRPLSDSGFEKLSKFKGIYLLDAYVYNTFDVNELPLQVRGGNQVLNWGESLFVQGVNQINPIDVPSFRKPGAQLKEVFLPVPIIDLSQSLGAYGSIEGFWQAKWKNTPIEASCGNYWSVAVGNISTSPGVCDNAITLAQSNAYGDKTGLYIPTIEGRRAKDSGQYGIAYRFSSDRLDTEFGAYFTNLHARTPVISVQRGSTTPSPFSVFWEYPEDIKTVGLSASTNIRGWSVSGEVSHAKGVPAQINGADLLFSSLAAGGALPGVPAGTPFGPYGAPASGAFASASGYLPGYTRTYKNQVQVNAVKAGNKVLGADQYLLIAEVALQRNGLPDYKSDPTAYRYGRPFIFGAGSNAAYGGSTCGPLNISAEGCKNDGYMSRTSWGYRLKGELTYNDLIPGVTVYPGLYWAHDVRGNSIDSQFQEGRMTLAPSVRFSYDKRFMLEVGAVFYNKNAKYDALRDRSSYYATGSMSF